MGNRKIRVLEVCAVDFTVKNLLLPLINRLMKEGYEVEICCTPGNESKKLEQLGYKFKYVYIDRKINLLSNLKSLIGLYRVMKDGKYDIVHVHTPLASALGRIAAKLARIPIIIYTAHGFYFHENMPKIEYKIFTTLEKILGKYFTDYIFVQSEEDYKTAKQLGIIEEDKISCISNGIDLEKFDPENVQIDTVAFKSVLGIPPEGKVITFIGRIVKEKGILDLLDVFIKLANDYKDIYLLIVGDVSSNERDIKTKERIKDILKDKNIGNRIIMAEYRDDIPEILKISDIFVLPSYREGLPRSIIEAMAMSKPVVTYNIRGCREEVVNGETGFLVSPGDLNGLYSSIKKILDNPELAKEFGSNGRRRAEELYDEQKVLEKELKIFRFLEAQRLGDNRNKSATKSLKEKEKI
jgi:glycosyltransferase involved in cell wall biosynthesis